MRKVRRQRLGDWPKVLVNSRQDSKPLHNTQWVWAEVRDHGKMEHRQLRIRQSWGRAGSSCVDWRPANISQQRAQRLAELAPTLGQMLREDSHHCAPAPPSSVSRAKSSNKDNMTRRQHLHSQAQGPRTHEKPHGKTTWTIKWANHLCCALSTCPDSLRHWDGWEREFTPCSRLPRKLRDDTTEVSKSGYFKIEKKNLKKSISVHHDR